MRCRRLENATPKFKDYFQLIILRNCRHKKYSENKVKLKSFVTGICIQNRSLHCVSIPVLREGVNERVGVGVEGGGGNLHLYAHPLFCPQRERGEIIRASDPCTSHRDQFTQRFHLVSLSPLQADLSPNLFLWTCMQ